jgi:two-component system, LuxR family, response regulator FixJ
MPTVLDPPTVFVVENDRVVQESLSISLAASGMPVYVFDTAEAFLEVHTTKMRGCLLVDIELPQMDGIDLIAALGDRATRLPSVAMSGLTHTPLVVEAMRTGAVDFLAKPFTSHNLVRALHVALHWASTGAADMRSDAVAAASRVATLTPRERTIFNNFATGASTKQVADILALSPKTVETYRMRLLHKLDVSTPYALVRLAVLTSLFGPCLYDRPQRLDRHDGVTGLLGASVRTKL